MASSSSSSSQQQQRRTQQPSATMVSMPPRVASSSSSAIVGASSSENNNINSIATATTTMTALPTTAMDPESLLDALDTFTTSSSAANNRYAAVTSASNISSHQQGDNNTNNNSEGDAPTNTNTNNHQQQQQQHNFDPIDFLNQHYHTEQQLVSALPELRSAISTRLSNLDDTLSTTLRHQAALAPTLAKDVQHARYAVIQLTKRIQQVQQQAQKSEIAVLEITRDMKRLDFAKKHLQRTITALKRLHMLLHAAEQLRMAAMVTPQQPIPRYATAAHLVDATRLLLGHFDGYMNSVPKMRQVRDAVGVIKGQLWEGIVKLFYEVGCQQTEQQLALQNDGEDGEGGNNNIQTMMPVPPPSSMVQKTLADACLVVEALGPKSKERFITDFIKDHLHEYDELYNPSPAASSGKKKGSGASSSAASGGSQSFKKSGSDVTASVSGSGSNSNSIKTNNSNTKPTSLDNVENRFTWFRNKLRSLQHQFAHVFPPQWNVQYRLTVRFLEMTARHLKYILKKYYNKNTVRIPPFTSSSSTQAGSSSGAVAASVTSAISSTKFGSMSVSSHGNKSSHGSEGSDGISDGEKAVTALLKALQKTILFEKEMSAWLTRDFGTKFIDPSQEGEEGAGGSAENKGLDTAAGDGDNDLEFDERGRAVPAKSAEGIKIKYERRKRMGGVESTPVVSAGGPVSSLVGIASTTFDDHMSPYVSLEERSMDEQLFAASSDNTVDTRGESPVFVSSTNLFIYMKNSITRCTALTKEKTFFLLQRAFQKKLCSYAGVLEKKLPSPLSGGISAKMALANIQGAVSSQAAANTYRIPPGEEVTICHVITTCEYCSDTVEALEDLIRDKIGHKYKEKIDMSEEQGAFQDVTAKSIRVLVSGLEQRLDAGLKEISRTNWSSFDMVGEESSYVRTIHLTVHPFVVQVRGLIPSSYFRSFCDKFALSFATTYYKTLIGLKRISEAGTQQLLLDVYSIKTLLLKLPVLEAEKKAGTSSRNHANTNLSGGSTIAPAIYTKMVNKEFRKLEVMLKLVGSPKEMLVDMFRAQWDCSMDTTAMATDFIIIMTLKGIPRQEHSTLLETLGVEAGETSNNDSAMTSLQERGSDVAAKVNADLNQMRQRVDDFRKAFR